MKIIGAAVGYTEKEEQIEKVRNIIEDSKKLFDLEFTLRNDDLTVYNEYVGGGYGFMSESKLEAVKLLAETEGLMIDPVYTATAMACLIDLVKQGKFKEEDNVLFLHTGGAVALFPYKEPLKSHVKGNSLPWKIPPWSPSAE